MQNMIRSDYVLVECELDKLIGLVKSLEKRYKLQTVKKPSLCLTMVRAEDSIEYQEFYLGEALTTECEVACNEAIGYGICLSEEPQRAYCLAAVNAIIEDQAGVPEIIASFIEKHYALLEQAERVEFNHLLKTRVDFKLFDED